MKKKWLTAGIIYIALIIICIVVIYVVPSVKGLLEKTYVTEYGNLDIKDEVSGYIVRDEVVYVASQDCEIKRLAEEGKLIKAGTRVLEITPASSGEDNEGDGGKEEESAISNKYVSVMDSLGNNYRKAVKGATKYAGYIVYYVDGAEAKLSTSELGDLGHDDLDKLTKLKHVETPAKKAVKGEPLYKVIRNRKWYYVFYLDSKAGEKYYEGRTVTMTVGGRDITVKVASVETGKDATRVALAVKTVFDGFFDERTVDAVITVASAQGLILRDSSIVEVDGQKGVLVKNKLGEHKFKPISIKADDGEKCVAYSDIYVDEGGNFVETIGTYDEIVAEPTAEDIEELNNRK